MIKLLPPYLSFVKKETELPDYSDNLLNSLEINMKSWR